MEQGVLALAMAALGLGAFHTLIGPDHYLPFVAIAQTKKWSTTRTLWVVSICGLGHVLSTILLGALLIIIGVAVEQFIHIEGQRGTFVSWVLLVLGSVYMLWAVIQYFRKGSHSHSHLSTDKANQKKVTFWVLFAVFVFGPCEALSPLLYQASAISTSSLVLVSILFAVSTIGMMLIMTFLLLQGFKFVKIQKLEKYQHIVAGATIALCGAGMIFLGF